MNRPTEYSEATTALELNEATFSPTPTTLDFTSMKEPGDISFPVEWDDFDTGSLDD